MNNTTKTGLSVPALLGATLLLAAGCGDFEPRSYLTDLRVLTLVASPVEVGPGETMTVTPHLYVPPGDTVTSRAWSFCPFTLGASVAYKCAAPSCETPLTEGADGKVSVEPYKLAASCVARLVGSSGGVPGVTGAGGLPDAVPGLLRLRVASQKGPPREAVLRPLIWTQKAPAARNRNPVISRVEADGVTIKSGDTLPPVKEGAKLKLRMVVDPKSLDSYTDAAGRQREEVANTAVYATAGRFEYDREEGPDVTSTWSAEQLAAGETEARIYLVVSDLRGGQTVAGPFIVPIQRTAK